MPLLLLPNLTHSCSPAHHLSPSSTKTLLRLGATALRALAAPPAELRRLAGEALAADFPPARMLRRYDRQWARLVLASRAARGAAAAAMEPAEAEFYSAAWKQDNTPYDPRASAARAAERARRERRAWLHNIVIIAMQVRGVRRRSVWGARVHRERAVRAAGTAAGSPTRPRPCSARAAPRPAAAPPQAVLQLPSLLCLLWYSSSSKAGSVLYADAASSWAAIATSPTSLYFYCYALSAAACQVRRRRGSGARLGRRPGCGSAAAAASRPAGWRTSPLASRRHAHPGPRILPTFTQRAHGWLAGHRPPRPAPNTPSHTPTSLHPHTPIDAQAIGYLVPPLLYMRLATLGLAFSTLCLLWSLWVPTVRSRARALGARPSRHGRAHPRLQLASAALAHACRAVHPPRPPAGKRPDVPADRCHLLHLVPAAGLPIHRQ